MGVETFTVPWLSKFVVEPVVAPICVVAVEFTVIVPKLESVPVPVICGAACVEFRKSVDAPATVHTALF